MKLKSGQILANRYMISEMLGEGGMGFVYKALSVNEINEHVAIKVIQNSNITGKGDLLHRFQKEAASLSRLNHTNIVSFREFGLHFQRDSSRKKEGSYYLVMDLIPGNNLKWHIQNGVSDFSFFFQIAMQIASALDYMHSKAVIHRDLKPSNILVKTSHNEFRGYKAVILDFGISTINGIMSNYSEKKSFTSIFKDPLLGTPLYMAPELGPYGKGLIDHRADLYSLGCILYEMLVGHAPFYKGSRNQILKDHKETKAEEIKNLRPETPVFLCQIIKKLLNKNPNDRYQSVMSLIIDLQKAFLISIDPKYSNNAQFKVDGAEGGLLNYQLPEEIYDDRIESINIIKNVCKEKLFSSTRGLMLSLQGSSGLGKTYMINQLRSFLLDEKISFVSGEFLPSSSLIPFQGISTAFYDYWLRIEQESDDFAYYCEKIKSTLGSNLKLLLALIPELKKFYPVEKKKSSYISLKDVESKVLVKVFSDFLRCMNLDEKPVVYIFDDIHLADKLSLQLLEVFLDHINTQKLLLIISYQPWFCQFNDNLNSFIKKMSSFKRRFTPVLLTPFSKQSTIKYIKNIYQFNVSENSPFWESIYLESKGNPLSIHTIVKSILKSTHIFFDNHEYSADSISLVDNISVYNRSLEVISLKLESYTAIEWKIFESLSLMGERFYIFDKIIENIDSEAIFALLLKAESDGIIRKLKNKNEDHLSDVYKFSHYYLWNFIQDGISLDRQVMMRKKLFAKLIKDVADVKGGESISIIINQLIWFHKNGVLFEVGVNESHLIQVYSLITSNFRSNDAYQNIVLYQNYIKICLPFKSNKMKSCLSTLYYELNTLYSDIGFWRRSLKYLYRSYLLNSKQNIMSMFHSNLYIQCRMDLLEGLVLKNICNMGGELYHKNICRVFKSKLIFFVNKLFFKKKSSYIESIINKLQLNFDNLDNFERQRNEGFNKVGSFELIYMYQILIEILFYSNRLDFYQENFYKKRIKEKMKIDAKSIFNIDLMIKVLLHEIGVLSAKNAIEDCNKYLTRTMQLAYRLKNKTTISILRLARSIFIHYELNQVEDLNINIKEGLHNLMISDNPIIYSKAVSLLAFSHILRGHLCGAENIIKSSWKMNPNANIATNQWMSLLLFIYLMNGRRDLIVSSSEIFNNAAKYIPQSIFSEINSLFIAYAKGDEQLVRDKYHLMINLQLSTNNSLFAFERDFISLIIVSFPLFFEQEQKRKLMRASEFNCLYKKIRNSHDSKLLKNIAIQQLYYGRILQKLKKKNGNLYLENASEGSLVHGQELVFCLSQIFLSSDNKRAREYFDKAEKITIKSNFVALQRYLNKVKIKELYTHPGSMYRKDSFKHHAYNFPTSLALDHLVHISGSRDQILSNKYSVQRSLELLLAAYRGKSIYLLLMKDGLNAEFYSFPVDFNSKSIELKLVEQQIEQYLGISECLFITEAKLRSSNSESDLSFKSSTKITVNDEIKTEVQESLVKEDQTLIVEDEKGNELTESHIIVYIPLSLGAKALGLLRIDSINKYVYERSILESKKELNLFAAQISYLINRDSFLGVSVKKPVHKFGLNVFEDCTWLSFFEHKPALIEPDVEYWAVGSNLNAETYLLFFCWIEGGVKAKEGWQQLSSEIWHHLQILIQNEEELKKLAEPALATELITGLLNFLPSSSKINDLAISYTLFNKSSDKIWSAHIGKSRPLVLGGENSIKPYNEPIHSNLNGKDFRYWEVQSSWQEENILLTCRNTHVFDANKLWSHFNSSTINGINSGWKAKIQNCLETFVSKSEQALYYIAVKPKNEK